MIFYTVLILILPLLNFLQQLLLGSKLKKRSMWISSLLIWLSFALSLALVGVICIIMEPDYNIEKVFNRLQIGGFKASFGISINNISVIVLSIFAFICSLTDLYCFRFLVNRKGDISPEYTRYYKYLSLFIFAVYGAILSNNLFLLLIFWMLITICIVFINSTGIHKKSDIFSFNKSVLINLVADVLLFTGILSLFSITRSFNYKDIIRILGNTNYRPPHIDLIGIIIVFSVIAKVFLVPFHNWLEGSARRSIPLTAQVQGSGIIIAGLFLLFRLFPIFSSAAMLFLAYIGLLSAVISIFIAISQRNLKSLLMYIVASQVGFVVFGFGVGAYTAAFVQLVASVISIVLLLLSLGAVIPQAIKKSMSIDIKDSLYNETGRIQGISKNMFRLSLITAMISILSMVGIPFTAGFLGRSAIVNAGVLRALNEPIHWLLPIFAFIFSLLNGFALFRLFFYIYGKENEFDKSDFEPTGLSNKTILPLSLLSFLSLFVIYGLPGFNPLFIGDLTLNLIHQPSSFQSLGLYIISDQYSSYFISAALSILLGFIGMFCAWLIYPASYVNVDVIKKKVSFLYDLSLNRFYFDKLIQKYLVAFLERYSQPAYDRYHKIMDRFKGRIAALFKRTALLLDSFEKGVLGNAFERVSDVLVSVNSLLDKVLRLKTRDYLFMTLLIFLIIIVMYIL